jgi:hypothetical protein
MELFIQRNENWALIAVPVAPAARKAYPRKSGLSLWRVPPSSLRGWWFRIRIFCSKGR